MAYLFDDDQVKKIGWTIAIVLIILALQVRHSTFTCNPNVCEVKNQNTFGFTLYTKKVNIEQIQRFETREYYSFLEGGKHSTGSHYRETIYAIPKYGQPYRFMGASHKSRYSYAEDIVNKLNKLLPTTQDKMNVKIKF